MASTSTTAISTRIGKSLLDKYLHGLEHQPYPFHMASCGALLGFGDYMSQRADSALHGHPFKYDLARGFQFTLYGVAVAGPAFCWWYRALDRMVLRHSSLQKYPILTKICFDQFVFEPVFLASSFGVLSAMEGKNSQQVVDKLKKDFPSTYAADCLFWTNLQFLNFRFAPVRYQALVVSVYSTVWNSYFSFVAHKPHQASETVEAKSKSSNAMTTTDRIRKAYHTPYSASLELFPSGFTQKSVFSWA